MTKTAAGRRAAPTRTASRRDAFVPPTLLTYSVAHRPGAEGAGAMGRPMPVVDGEPVLEVRDGGLWYWKSGAFLSWSLVQVTLSFTSVGSGWRAALPALPVVPLSAGIIWNASMAMATFFSPMPRNPPTPT